MKNIVICCDGTGNKFGDTNSNVVKFYEALSDTPEQVTYYHPGLGTMGSRVVLNPAMRWFTRVLGLAIGYGIMDNIADAYLFLMNEYEPSDKVFLFGFSRGAYTARAIAAMLHMFGLIKRGNDILVPYALEMFRSKVRDKHSFEVAQDFKNAFSHVCKPHFVGVWDSVSSVGWLYDPLNLPFTFHNPDIAVARHALSVDEKRCAFRQNLWEPLLGQDSKQVWFAGVHSDVGGGYDEAQSGLAKLALQWMLREAGGAQILVDEQKANRLLGLGDLPSSYSKPDCKATLHVSLTPPWWILEVFPRRHWDTRLRPPRFTWTVPFGSRRHIPEGSTLHESVLQRKKCMPDYQPDNLPNNFDVES